jgi:hypothetical protein
MKPSSFSYDTLITKYYDNNFNDFINTLSTEEIKNINNVLQKQLTKQVKILNDETDKMNTILECRLRLLHITDGLYKLHFCKSITTLNNKIYKLIELYKTIEITEELICLTTEDKQIPFFDYDFFKSVNEARLHNLITFYKPIIKTIEHYINFLDFKQYIPTNTYYNIANLIAYIFSNYNELIKTNDITIYHKSLFSDLDKYNIPYLNLPVITLRTDDYIQAIITTFITTQKTIECYIKNTKWITDLIDNKYAFEIH